MMFSKRHLVQREESPNIAVTSFALGRRNALGNATRTLPRAKKLTCKLLFRANRISIRILKDIGSTLNVSENLKKSTVKKQLGRGNHSPSLKSPEFRENFRTDEHTYTISTSDTTYITCKVNHVILSSGA